MIEIKPKKLNKRHLAIIIAAGLLVFLIIGYAIINAVIKSLGDKDGEGGGTTADYDPSIGESYMNNSPTVYAYIPTTNIMNVLVDSHEGAFMMSRPVDDNGNLLNYFEFSYEVDGRLQRYLPDIVDAESSFNYTSLYSTTSDGINAPKIEYILATLSMLSFNYRIDMAEDTVNSDGVNLRENQLKLYGLDEEHRQSISMQYIDGYGNSQILRIFIGNKLLGDDNRGYYIMLEGRDYIYASVGSQNFALALSGFESFLHSRVVAAGLSSDGTFEPYLTTNYQQWISNYYSYREEAGVKIPYAVTKDSEVIILADILLPIYDSGEETNMKPDEYGYYHLGYKEVSIKLSSLAGRGEFDSLVSALVGKDVDLEERAEDEIVTVVNGMNSAVVYDAESGKGVYEYEILAIKSVITDSGELTAAGTAVGDSALVKVVYNYSVDGTKQNVSPAVAVLDLSKEATVHYLGDKLAAIKAASVGVLESPITLSVAYSEDRAPKRSVTYVVTAVSMAANLLDSGELQYLNVIGEDSIVSLDYEIRVAGKAIANYENQYFDFSKIEDGVSLEIKKALVGRGIGKYSVSVPIGDVYYQVFEDFSEYRIKQIVGFVEEELVVAFRYRQDSEKDAFLRETTYINTIGNYDSSNPRKENGLNVEACDKVVKLFGGINPDGSSQQSEGLVGIETVAVGLTPEVLKRYGLYDGFRVYFELPRGITAHPYNADDYAWGDELGFTLYISASDAEGYRYIASDMYDIVVKIEGSQLDFLDESFADFWARRNLVMVEYSDIDRISVDFNFSNLAGKYSFRCDNKIKYISENGKFDSQQYQQDSLGNYALDSNGNKIPLYQEYKDLDVYASIEGLVPGQSSVEGVYDETGLSILLTNGTTAKSELDLAVIYNKLFNEDGTEEALSINYDTYGTYYFKEFLMVLFATYYMGSLDTESQEVIDAMEREALLSLAFYVEESDAEFEYVYDFHRVDDRRVAVNVYKREVASGACTEGFAELYITDFAFEKIVRSIQCLLNGDAVVPDMGYDELK